MFLMGILGWEAARLRGGWPLRCFPGMHSWRRVSCKALCQSCVLFLQPWLRWLARLPRIPHPYLVLLVPLSPVDLHLNSQI